MPYMSIDDYSRIVSLTGAVISRKVSVFSTLTIRLHPGQDLLQEMNAAVCSRNIEAACVLTCVGSLTRAVLRLANQSESTMYSGHFEIVSLTGLLSTHGSHCHIAISDTRGRTIGAHLLDGCEIYTTAEIILGVFPDKRFMRIMDVNTGYPELVIHPNP